MGLDFTDIKDEQGAAVYLLHDGTTASQQKMERLAGAIQEGSDKQAVVLNVNEGNGRKILDFYDLQTTNAVLIVRDDDQLHQFWSEAEIPGPDQIIYTVNQVG